MKRGQHAAQQTRQRRGRKPPARNAGDRLGRWRLSHALGSSTWLVVDETGVRGVATVAAPEDHRVLAAEAAALRRLSSDPGVLPLLDVDPSPRPAWLVTAETVPLADHYPSVPDLGSVVADVAELADTLHGIRVRAGLAHLGITPAALRWHGGRPVLAGFGRHEDTGPDGLPAYAVDVAALAGCLRTLAGPAVRLPRSLSRILELAESPEPRDRPTMRELGDELRCWLDRPTRPGGLPWSGDEDLLDAGSLDLDQLLETTVRATLLQPLRDCGPQGDAGAVELSGEALLGDHPATRPEPTDIPDGRVRCQLSWHPRHGHRLVVAGYRWRDQAFYLLEWHSLDGAGVWKLHWSGSDHGRLGLPSHDAACASLARRARAAAP